MSIASERLKETLQFWKDFRMMRELDVLNRASRARIEPTENALKVLRSWRTYEAQVMGRGSESFNPMLHMTPNIGRDDRDDGWFYLKQLEYFPVELHTWSHESRRNLHLNRQLEEEIAEAEYPNVRWKDVLWPFQAFTLTLERPIRMQEDDDVWADYDTILVSNIDPTYKETRKRCMSIRFFRKPHASELKTFPAIERQRVENLLRGKRYEEAFEAGMRGWQKRMEGVRVPQGWRGYTLYDDREMNPDMEVAMEPEQVELQFGDKLAEVPVTRLMQMCSFTKLVAGFCIYLKYIDTATIRWKKPKYPTKEKGIKGLTGSITNVENFCTMVGRGTIDPVAYNEERLKKHTRFFTRYHVRRAHMRRPRGTPKTHPKTIEVREAHIRLDLKEPGTLMGGSDTKILPEE